jgi:D-alanyl-D-alanine carboxypeptidase/D-alanyl-D-alanine-endopeptidase (penicillin-binding protein 4)
VRGKTGTLYGTYNIAGIMSTAAGKPLLFVQMVTNYHHPDYHRHEKREIRAFERQFYKAIHAAK